MPYGYQKLQLALEDLQKIVDQHKKFYGETWHTIVNTDGDYMIVPALDALVYGYAQLEDLDDRVEAKETDEEAQLNLYLRNLGVARVDPTPTEIRYLNEEDLKPRGRYTDYTHQVTCARRHDLKAKCSCLLDDAS